MHIQQVVDAALRLLSERGLPDLSMRRVAAALEVQPSALYWHVSSKQHLLGLVADRILDSCPQLDDVADQLEALRRVLLEHRDGAELVASSIALGMGGGRLREMLATSAAKVQAETRPAVVEACALLLLGSTQLEQQRAQAAAIGVAMGDQHEAPRLRDLAQLILVGASQL